MSGPAGTSTATGIGRRSTRRSMIFDADYVEQASTTTCPACGAKRDLATLIARRDDDGNTIFEMQHADFEM